jgi:hypothetical protein
LNQHSRIKSGKARPSPLVEGEGQERKKREGGRTAPVFQRVLNSYAVSKKITVFPIRPTNRLNSVYRMIPKSSVEKSAVE